MQDYDLPSGSDYANVALKVLIPNSLEALRSNFSGAVEPASALPFQFWADTGSGFLKMRNAGGTAWVKVAQLALDSTVQLASEGWAATISATKNDWLATAPRAGNVKRLVLSSSGGTASSGGTEWQVQLTKYPNANPASPVNLFSGTVGTFTTLSGVGGGVEFVASKALVFTPNQNQAFADLDKFSMQLTKVGSPANLAGFRATLEIE